MFKKQTNKNFIEGLQAKARAISYYLLLSNHYTVRISVLYDYIIGS